MTSSFLISDLKRDEGYAKALSNGDCEAYPDPLHGWAKPTIGYGHTGPEVKEGLVWTSSEALIQLLADVREVKFELGRRIAWWLALDDLRQDVIVNMGFNLGVYGLLEFTTFLGLVREGAYAAAADDLEATPWAREVGDRATRLIAQMRTGVHQA